MIILALALAAAHPAICGNAPGAACEWAMLDGRITRYERRVFRCLQSRTDCAIGISEARQRALLCTGPVARVSDNDPGLILYLANPTLDDAKIVLADNRANAC
jgi:hypothetical protein